MNFFDANAAFLSERFPGFSGQILTAYAPAEDFFPEASGQGAPTAKYRGIYLHSRLDPLREAERLISRELPEDAGCFVVEGFGLGYHAEAILRRFPGVPCLVVEADIPCFISALSVRDLRGIFAREEFSLLLSPEPSALSEIREFILSGRLAFLKFRPTYEGNKGYYERIDAAIRACIERRDINSNTLKRFGKLWVKNLVRNLPLVAETEGIACFIGKFSGLPAFICAAGPSLDRAFPILPEIRKRCLLIAVDTSYRSVIDSGAEPDFVVVVDPQYWNSRHLDWAKPSGAVLISESATHPRVFHLPVARRFFAASLFPLGVFLEDRIGKKTELGAGGSVSTTAWDFARICGAGPILFAGLDLGFPRRQTHYRGSFFEERAHTASHRQRPAETASFLALRDAGPYLAENNSGGKTLTDKRLSVYSGWFEAQLARHPEAVTFNLSPEGIRIQGMPYKELESVLSLPPMREEIDRRMGEALACGAGLSGPEDMKTRLSSALGTLKKELSDIAALAEEGLSVIDKMKRPGIDGVEFQGFLAFLDTLDRRILSSSSKDVAGFLARPILEEIINAGSKRPDREDILENPRKMYAEILESVRFHLSTLEKP